MKFVFIFVLLTAQGVDMNSERSIGPFRNLKSCEKFSASYKPAWAHEGKSYIQSCVKLEKP